MTLPTKLAEKDSASFRNKQVRIRKEGSVFLIDPTGDEINFQDMMKLRKDTDPEEIKRNLSGEGHLFANIGISGALSTTYQGKHYALLVRQDRPDFGDSVSKLLSGYTPAHKATDLASALDDEIAEELIFCTEEGKIISGMRNLKHLPRPYENVAQYDPRVTFQLFDVDLHTLPGLTREPIDLAGIRLAGNPQLMFDAKHNSAQMVYRWHVDLPGIPVEAIEHGEIPYLTSTNSNAGHSEDKFNPQIKKLEVMLQEQGIHIAPLKGGMLTGEIFTFEKGKLVPFDGKVTLSEAFAPKSDGIVTQNNISLGEYLALQGR